MKGGKKYSDTRLHLKFKKARKKRSYINFNGFIINHLISLGLSTYLVAVDVAAPATVAVILVYLPSSSSLLSFLASFCPHFYPAVFYPHFSPPSQLLSVLSIWRNVIWTKKKGKAERLVPKQPAKLF